MSTGAPRHRSTLPLLLKHAKLPRSRARSKRFGVTPCETASFVRGSFVLRLRSFRAFGLGACLDGESGQFAGPGQGPAQAWHAAAASTDPSDLGRRCNILPPGEGRNAGAARHSKRQMLGRKGLGLLPLVSGRGTCGIGGTLPFAERP